jgi:ATP-dependent Clp protease ATP-binding subunit ClpC
MPTEVPHSPGIAISHTAASIETDALHQETVSPDLSICGITKLEDFLSQEILRKIGLSAPLIPPFVSEAQQLLDLLHQSGIEPRQTRRTLRERVGKGNYTGPARDRISRSDAVRSAFNRANDIAADHNARIVMVWHLLAALLEIPDTHFRAVLAEAGIDVDALREKAAALPVPQMDKFVSDGPLTQFGVDLTAKAHAGELSPVLGRKTEMLQVIKVLGRDKKNCPVLVGAAGVGKTAIVEGLAQRIAVKNLHPDFHDKRIVQLDAEALVAGTKYRGDFEERMTQLIAAISLEPDLILFIDEIHLLVGAGASGSGGMDAANILKPALANGRIKLIGATTDAEYRQYIEKDAALDRRFEAIRVLEPSRKETIEMLIGLRNRLQEKHGVTILDEALTAAVDLSVRYITDRFLPDKAYTLLDSACTEAKYGAVLSYRPDQSGVNQPLNAVTEETIRVVLARTYGDHIRDHKDDDIVRIAGMGDALRQRIVGQDAAIEAVTKVVQRHYTLSRLNRPIGIFLFTGSTGVGKTELARAVAAFRFYDEKRLIRLDMGEYMEKHNVQRLIGAPPSYVGYEQGGQLTNALKHTPNAVVLIDEIEKAHPDVLNVFLGLFDHGHLTDGQGKTVDAQNALFIMTSNLGYPTAASMPTPDEVKAAVYAQLRPEFINRLDAIIQFQPLQQGHIVRLVEIQREQLASQLERYFIELEITPEAKNLLAQRGYDPQMGARALIRLFEEQVSTPISLKMLKRELHPHEIARVRVENNNIVIDCITRSTDH